MEGINQLIEELVEDTSLHPEQDYAAQPRPLAVS